MIWTDYSWWLLLFFTFVIHLFFDLKFAPQKSCIQNNSPQKMELLEPGAAGEGTPWTTHDCHWSTHCRWRHAIEIWMSMKSSKLGVKLLFFPSFKCFFVCFLLLLVNLLIPKNQLGPSNGGVWTTLACCPDQPYGQFQHSDQTGPLWISYLTWSWAHPFKHSVA